jgi:hypothetical protein
MHSEIRQCGDDGVDRVVGSIRLIDGQLVADPPEHETLRRILRRSWLTQIDGEHVILSPVVQPELLLRNLCLILRTAYLRATPVGED